MNSTDRKVPTLRASNLLLLIFSACMLLSSCSSPGKSVALAQQSVEQFHTQLNSEGYAAIYAASDDKLHQTTSETDFLKLLQAVHRKLGNVLQSSLQNTGVAWYAGQGATVTLVYDTKFTGGSATEQFVWHIKDNGTALYSYHINSNDLITK